MKQVRDFHEKYGLPVDENLRDHKGIEATHSLKLLAAEIHTITEDSLERAVSTRKGGDHRLWRMHLLLGEVAELAQSLAERNEIELADALGDLDYVVKGTAVTYNIPLDYVAAEIHKSNMTKQLCLRPKGPDYVPPDIEGAIKKGRELAGGWEA